jgi:hypothetical protein
MTDDARDAQDQPTDVTGPTEEPSQPITATPTQAVRGSTRSRPRTASRFRWAVAAFVTLIVLAASAGGFAILSAGAATSALVGYVPADSVGYLELRLDAPGDQRQNAANLLSHFPGFADQSTLGTKLDEALDQLIGDASAGKQSFTGNVKGWLGDSVALVMTRLTPMGAAPATGGSGATPGDGTRARAGLLLVSVTDPAAARTWAESTFGAGGAAESYAGIPLTSIQTHGATVEFGVVSNVLLAGDPQSVHDAIDSKGTSPFATSASFKAAAAAISGDRLAFGYLDLAELSTAIDAARPQLSDTTKLALQQLPAWLSVTVRAESNSLSATVALPDTNLAPVAANHSSILATRLPPTTVAAAELHDIAALVGSVTTTIGEPAASASPDPVNQALQAVGGIDGLVGWIGDGTVALVRGSGPGTSSGASGAATTDPSDLQAGFVIQAKDAAAADTKLTELKNLVSLVGSSVGISSSTETYNGTTITIIDAGDVTRFMPAGSTAAAPGGASLPTTDLRIAIAQKDDLVIAGIGDGFVKSVLDTKPGATLADQQTYRDALGLAGASNTGQLYVDLQSVLDLATQHLSAAGLAHYQSDLQPYLAPFRAVAAAGSAGDPNRARVVITVK